MTIDKIEEIIQNANADYWTKPAKEIYKKHLEDKLTIVKTLVMYFYHYPDEDFSEEIQVVADNIEQQLKELK